MLLVGQNLCSCFGWRPTIPATLSSVAWLRSGKNFALIVIELRSTLTEFPWLVWRHLVESNEVKLVGWIDFEGTLRLALDAVDVADWKAIIDGVLFVSLSKLVCETKLLAAGLIKVKKGKILRKSSQMKRVLIANNLYLHVRSKPGHLLPLTHAYMRQKRQRTYTSMCFK